MRTTPLSRLIDIQMAGNLRDHVRDCRAEGVDWRSLAADISERTGTRVSYETLRSWFEDEADQAVGGAA